MGVIDITGKQNTTMMFGRRNISPPRAIVGAVPHPYEFHSRMLVADLDSGIHKEIGAFAFLYACNIHHKGWIRWAMWSIVFFWNMGALINGSGFGTSKSMFQVVTARI